MWKKQICLMQLEKKKPWKFSWYSQWVITGRQQLLNLQNATKKSYSYVALNIISHEFFNLSRPSTDNLEHVQLNFFNSWTSLLTNMKNSFCNYVTLAIRTSPNAKELASFSEDSHFCTEEPKIITALSSIILLYFFYKAFLLYFLVIT